MDNYLESLALPGVRRTRARDCLSISIFPIRVCLYVMQPDAFRDKSVRAAAISVAKAVLAFKSPGERPEVTSLVGYTHVRPPRGSSRLV